MPALSPTLAETASRTQDAQDRCERFATRMDAHLAKLSDDDARAFLDQQFQKFRRDYAEFQTEVALGVYRGTATAWDYAVTLADISRRQSEYEPRTFAVAAE